MDQETNSEPRIRIYTFTKSLGGGHLETYHKTEDKLTQKELDLLLGDAINEIDKLPQEVRDKLWYHLLTENYQNFIDRKVDEIESKFYESPKSPNIETIEPPY